MRISDWSSDVCSSDLRVVGLVELDLDLRALDREAGEQTGQHLRADALDGADPQAPSRAGGHGVDVGQRAAERGEDGPCRSEEHTSELQSLMRISYAVFCLKKKNTYKSHNSATA